MSEPEEPVSSEVRSTARAAAGALSGPETEALRKALEQIASDQPDVDLALYQSLGNFQFVTLYELRHELVFGLVLNGVLSLGFHALPDAGTNIIETSELRAQLFGEVVVKLWE